MKVQFTITREIDLYTIKYYQKKYPHWTLEEIIDFIFDDEYSDNNAKTIEKIKKALEEEKKK